MNRLIQLTLCATACAKLPLSARAVEGFACVGEQVAGIAFNRATKKWQATTFKANQTLVIKRPHASDARTKRFKWIAMEPGSDIPKYVCDNEFSQDGSLLCKGLGGQLHLNSRTLRFLQVQTFGYVEGTAGPSATLNAQEGDNTPYLAAGQCTRL
jgi:hypothetical protein